MKNKNALKPHIIAALIAIYTEKGYYLQVIRLLLTGKRVTTYKQKGYYLQPIHLFASRLSPIRAIFHEYFILKRM
jgi:cytochrome c oxidase assembly factor CtaG